MGHGWARAATCACSWTLDPRHLRDSEQLGCTPCCKVRTSLGRSGGATWHPVSMSQGRHVAVSMRIFMDFGPAASGGWRAEARGSYLCARLRTLFSPRGHVAALAPCSQGATWRALTPCSQGATWPSSGPVLTGCHVATLSSLSCLAVCSHMMATEPREYPTNDAGASVPVQPAGFADPCQQGVCGGGTLPLGRGAHHGAQAPGGHQDGVQVRIAPAPTVPYTSATAASHSWRQGQTSMARPTASPVSLSTRVPFFFGSGYQAQGKMHALECVLRAQQARRNAAGLQATSVPFSCLNVLPSALRPAVPLQPFRAVWS